MALKTLSDYHPHFKEMQNEGKSLLDQNKTKKCQQKLQKIYDS